MNARDYIYNALYESMYVLKDDVKGLSSYNRLDFDDYFGSANSQIVEDENGTEVLSEIADEYVEGKVVCTAKEGREMFDDIRDEALAEILQDIVDCCVELEEIDETDIKDVELDYYEKRVDNYEHELMNFKWIGEVNDELDSYSEGWMDDLYVFCFCKDNLNISKDQFAMLIGATHFFSDEDTRFNNTNDIAITYFREYDGEEKPSHDKTIRCEVHQVVGEEDEDPFDVIILKGEYDAIDRKGTKYNFHFYDPTFLEECEVDFVELLYGNHDRYDKKLKCFRGCMPPIYIYVNYDWGLVINYYEEHLQEIDPYDYEHEQLLELIDFALQDEYSELADMVTDDDFIKKLSEKINDENKIIKLYEDDFEEAATFGCANSVSILKEVELIDDDFGKYTVKEGTPFVPKNKKLALRYSQVWTDERGYSEEEGISPELYDYAIHNLGFMATGIPSFLGCTHVFKTEDGDVYGFIEQKYIRL